jgi:scyllo-inositol 2-dehydrogenase (NADP+)
MMLRGGVIGFGRMGITHFAILNSHPEVRIVAISDTHGLVRKSAQKYLGVEAYEDHEKMLNRMDLQFVVIATPTASHKETVQAALTRRIHVFVEKPFTLDPEQGRELVSLADARAVVNQVGYVMRFNEVFLQVRHLLDQQVLGDLVLFKMEMNGPTVLRDTKGNWRASRGTGGGCLYDFASHAIDLVNYLLGAPDRIVGTVLQSIHSAHVEDAVSATYLYQSGLRGNLLVNWSDPAYRKPAYRFEVLGRAGKIVADLHAYKVFFRSPPNIEGFTPGWNERYITDFVAPCRFYLRGFEFTRQLDHFVDCICGRRPGGTASFAQGLVTDSVIAQIRKDAQHAHGD